MKLLASLCRSLQLLALSVWFGGIIVLGFVVAPLAFGTIPREQAGEFMARVFTRFSGPVVYGCLVALVIGYLGKMALESPLPSGRDRIFLYAEGGILGVMTAIGIYIGAVLTPRMAAIREALARNPAQLPAAEQFGASHRLSEGLFTVNLILGLALFFFWARQMSSHKRERP